MDASIGIDCIAIVLLVMELVLLVMELVLVVMERHRLHRVSAPSADKPGPLQGGDDAGGRCEGGTMMVGHLVLLDCCNGAVLHSLSTRVQPCIINVLRPPSLLIHRFMVN